MATSVNIEPIVRSYCNGSVERLQQLARAAGAISDAAHSGRMYAHRIRPADFEALREFVACAAIDFTIIDILGEQSLAPEPADRQHSNDGYGREDWNQL